jgi:hypothetical protein
LNLKLSEMSAESEKPKTSIPSEESQTVGYQNDGKQENETKSIYQYHPSLQARTGRGIDPYTPCGWATPQKAIFFPLGYPFPYGPASLIWFIFSQNH